MGAGKPLGGRRVLVTGGAGFIGSHVVEAYLAAGWEVAVLDDLSSGRLLNLPAGVRLFVEDVRNGEGVKRAFAEFRPQVVNHHAARIDVLACEADPETAWEVNHGGTVHVLEAAAAVGGVGRFLFASSGGAIYGETAEPAWEDHAYAPVGVYGATKVACEEELEERAWPFDVVSLRYGNVYGPRGRRGVIPTFLRDLATGRRLVLRGGGLMVRDYVHVSDIARANVLASEKLEPGFGFCAFNLGTGASVSVNTLVSRLVGDPVPSGEGEVVASRLAVEIAHDVLGWQAEVSLVEGLARMRQAVREELCLAR